MTAPLGPDGAILTAAALGDEVARLVAGGASLLTFVGTDDRARGAGFGLHVALLRDGETIRIEGRVDGLDPRYPSITPRVPALHWDERELRDLLGVVPEGHPDPRRLVLRAEWPDGLHPLRKDFDPALAPPQPRTDSFAPRTVEGEEIVEIP